MSSQNSKENATGKPYVPPDFPLLMYELCKLAPGAQAHAFKLPDRKQNKVYFLIKVKELYPADKPKDTRSMSEVFELNLTTGESLIHEIRILQDEVIKPLYNEQFITLVEALIVKLKTRNPSQKLTQALANLHNQGFKVK